MAKEVSQRKNKPDYAIVIGEKLIASRSIPILCKNGIKVFMSGSLSPAEKEMIGKPREKYPNYIGKISIDDYMAGYLTATAMIKEAKRLELHDSNGNLNFLAFEGVNKTSFSSERVRGLNAVAAQHPEVKILQTVSTQWRYEDATRILPRLLTRYSRQRIAGVWCANSSLARGATSVLIATGKVAGKDFVTVGTDWDNAAIKSVNRGDVLAIAGGHVAIVAWILVLIHDYHNGIDSNRGEFINHVTLMDQGSSSKFLQYFSNRDWDVIDFIRYSKAENKQLKQYDFGFNAIFDDL